MLADGFHHLASRPRCNSSSVKPPRSVPPLGGAEAALAVGAGAHRPPEHPSGTHTHTLRTAGRAPTPCCQRQARAKQNMPSHLPPPSHTRQLTGRTRLPTTAPFALLPSATTQCEQMTCVQAALVAAVCRAIGARHAVGATRMVFGTGQSRQGWRHPSFGQGLAAAAAPVKSMSPSWRSAPPADPRAPCCSCSGTCTVMPPPAQQSLLAAIMARRWGYAGRLSACAVHVHRQPGAQRRPMPHYASRRKGRAQRNKSLPSLAARCIHRVT
jgi:hypothetical protein